MLGLRDEKGERGIKTTQQEIAFSDIMEAATEGEAIEPTPEKTSPEKGKNRKGLIVTLSIIVAILIIILLVLVFREQVAELLKNILYTPEELEIIGGHY